MAKSVDHTGRVFGRLKVLGLAERRGGHKLWRCSCICGREKITNGSNLVSGRTSSCGCLRNEVSGKRAKELFTRVTYEPGVASRNWLWNRYRQSAKQR